MRFAVALAALTWIPVCGQAFVEVAAIKPAAFPSQAYFEGFAYEGYCGGRTPKIEGNRVTVSRATVCTLIRAAYNVPEFRVEGVPAEFTKPDPANYYEIVGQAPGDAAPTLEQAREMLQALLADRFHLKLRREQREVPIYALMVGKDGSKLSTEPLTGCTNGVMPPSTGLRGSGFGNCQPKLTTEQIANDLTGEADRPVIDRTGLTGKYAFFLQYSQPGQELAPNAAPGLFTAIQEQLGLKLEPTRAPFEVLVVEEVTRPSAN